MFKYSTLDDQKIQLCLFIVAYFTVFIDYQIVRSKSMFLIDVELRQLHRCFGHSFVHRLQNILKQLNQKINVDAFNYFTKYCEHCQKHDRLLDQFSFIIKKNINFNLHVIVNILYIFAKLVFYLVNEAICF